MDAWETARSLLPDVFAMELNRYPTAEEIRLRLGRPPGIVIAGREVAAGTETVTQGALLHVLERATGASLHAAAPALREGYVNYRGLRIGVCGEAVYSGENLNGLKNFSSLAIRIARPAVPDCAGLIESLLEPAPLSVLILAPPGVGKTTFLRALIRAAARSFRVGVVDERGELSAFSRGESPSDLGQGSDVLVGVPKARGAMMLLRGMNPQIVAMDEITRPDDLRAARELAGCGVVLYATAHGKSLADMRKRALYRELLDTGIFDALVAVRLRGDRRVYEKEMLTP